MTTRIITVSIPMPMSPEERAQEYIDRVEQRRVRAEERQTRRWQKIADDLWNMALGGFAVFVAFAVLISL